MPFNANVSSSLSPFYFWLGIVLFHFFQTHISAYALLNTLFSLDYRFLLIAMNFTGLYIFLRHARIDFTVRVRMNQHEDDIEHDNNQDT